MKPYATKLTPTAAKTNASGAARPINRAVCPPVADIASVGAITPTESEMVPRKPICRRSSPCRGEPGPRVAVMADDASPAPRHLQGRFAGKRAFVTGAAGGIGRAVTERLVAEGAQVAGFDLVETSTASLSLIGDVAREDDVQAAVEQAVAQFGGLDVVVANAAVQLVGSDDRADRLDLDIWQRTLDVNLTGLFLTAKHGVRALLAAGGGAIVCTGSAAGQYGLA